MEEIYLMVLVCDTGQYVLFGKVQAAKFVALKVKQ